MHMRLSRGAWHIYASTTKLPATITLDKRTTIAFVHPGKNFLGKTGTHIADFPLDDTAIGVKLHSDEAFELETRLVLIDDQGRLTQPKHVIHIGDSSDSNFVKVTPIPKQLRGHIKTYQLQTRPYQYVDFPNIHLEAIKP